MITLKSQNITVVIENLPFVSARMWSARTEVKRQSVAVGRSEAQYTYAVIQGGDSQTSFDQANLHIRSRPEDRSIWNHLFGHETEHINLWLHFRTHVNSSNAAILEH